MIELEFLESLIRALDQSSVDSIEIERGGTRVRLSKSPAPAPIVLGGGPASSAPPDEAPGPTSTPAEEPQAVSRLVEVKSPMVGTFFCSPAPDAPAYVELGTQISSGDTLCIIEAMKLMNELESEVEGTVVEILVENAVPVEYGQVLFKIDPES